MSLLPKYTKLISTSVFLYEFTYTNRVLYKVNDKVPPHTLLLTLALKTMYASLTMGTDIFTEHHSPLKGHT